MFCAKESTSEGIRDVLRNQTLKLQKEKKLVDEAKHVTSVAATVCKFKEQQAIWWMLLRTGHLQLNPRKKYKNSSLSLFPLKEGVFSLLRCLLPWISFTPSTSSAPTMTWDYNEPSSRTSQVSFHALSRLSLRNMTVWGAESDIQLELNPQALCS